MTITSMDDNLIKIYSIKNIEKIKIINFSLKKDSNIDVIPSLLVTYNNGKTLILNERDKYFKTFVKKVTEVYNEEKDRTESNNIDPFKLNKEIEISSHDKEILENGILTNISKEYKFYEDKYEYDESLFFTEDEVKTLFPILKYHLEDFFKSNGLEINDNFKGYQNRYFTETKIDGLLKKISFNYIKISDNRYKFEISHLFDNLSLLNIEIGFKNNRIYVNLNIDIKDISVIGEYSYIQEENGLKYIKNINKNDLNIYYEDKYLEEVKNTEVINFDNDYDTNIKWFMLPWNAKYGYENITKNISDEERIIERHYIYNLIKDDFFTSKEKYTKVYQQLNRFNEITLDHMDKNISGFLIDDDVYKVETSFLDCNFKNGFYDEKLNGYFFYSLVKKDKNKFKLVKSIDNLFDKSDLLNKTLMLNLTKGVK